MKKSKYIILSLCVVLIGGLSSFNFKLENKKIKQTVKPITLDEYNKKVCEKDKIILVYFSASWCVVCGKMKPVIAEAEKQYGSKIEILRIDTERDKEVSEEFEVNALPMLIFYKNGQKKWTSEGLIDNRTLSAKIDMYLK